jgi:hypothetical protein
MVKISIIASLQEATIMDSDRRRNECRLNFRPLKVGLSDGRFYSGNTVNQPRRHVSRSRQFQIKDELMNIRMTVPRRKVCWNTAAVFPDMPGSSALMDPRRQSRPLSLMPVPLPLNSVSLRVFACNKRIAGTVTDSFTEGFGLGANRDRCLNFTLPLFPLDKAYLID